MEFLKSFELHLWWRALFAVGVAVALAAIAAKEKDIFILGAGIAAFALGEWIKRPQVGEMLPGGILKSWYEWRPCISGLVLNAVGIAVALWGAFRLLFW
jgi:hypothetical protein